MTFTIFKTKIFLIVADILSSMTPYDSDISKLILSPQLALVDT